MVKVCDRNILPKICGVFVFMGKTLPKLINVVILARETCLYKRLDWHSMIRQTQMWLQQVVRIAKLRRIAHIPS